MTRTWLIRCLTLPFQIASTTTTTDCENASFLMHLWTPGLLSCSIWHFMSGLFLYMWWDATCMCVWNESIQSCDPNPTGITFSSWKEQFGQKSNMHNVPFPKCSRSAEMHLMSWQMDYIWENEALCKLSCLTFSFLKTTLIVDGKVFTDTKENQCAICLFLFFFGQILNGSLICSCITFLTPYLCKRQYFVVPLLYCNIVFVVWSLIKKIPFQCCRYVHIICVIRKWIFFLPSHIDLNFSIQITDFT